ncbi:MAG: chloride channel protein [Thermoprotei archaeon]|nr:MAG: chloride channel protein [Thermoprotei archaeon]
MTMSGKCFEILPRLKIYLEKIKCLERWMILSLIIGVISGIGAIVLRLLVDLVLDICLVEFVGYPFPQPLGEGGSTLLKDVAVARPWLLPVVAGIGGLLSALLVYTFAPEAEGHGTDSVIHAFHRLRGFIRARVPVIKSLATAITIGTAGSAGKEGPIAQIGAGFGSWIANVLHLSAKDRRVAVLCGVAGGIGSIFKAPLGGAIFALEVLYKRDFEFEAWVPVFTSSIVGYAIFTSVWGTGHIFAIPENISFSIIELPFYFILGLIMGVVAIIYVKVFYGLHKLFKKLKIINYAKPAIGCLLTGFIGIFVPEALEMGYGWIQYAIFGEMDAYRMLIVGGTKILTTSLTVGSGGSGGVFAPSLVIGALLGGGLAKILNQSLGFRLNIAAFTVVSMMSFFSAAGKVPLASMIMVAEMTGGYELLIPAMLACATSYLVSGGYTLYINQVNSRIESPAHIDELNVDILRMVKVRDVMTKEVVTVSPEMSVYDIAELVRRTGHSGFPVVSDGKLIGLITYTDIIRLPSYERKKLKVKDIMKRPLVAYEDETLDKVVHRMITYRVGRFPVVKSKDSYRLIGIITRHDIIRGYENKVEEIHQEQERENKSIES